MSEPISVLCTGATGSTGGTGFTGNTGYTGATGRQSDLFYQAPREASLCSMLSDIALTPGKQNNALVQIVGLEIVLCLLQGKLESLDRPPLQAPLALLDSKVHHGSFLCSPHLLHLGSLDSIACSSSSSITHRQRRVTACKCIC